MSVKLNQKFWKCGKFFLLGLMMCLISCSVQVSYYIPLESEKLSKSQMEEIFREASDIFFDRVNENESLSKLLDNKINFNAIMKWRDPVGEDRYYFYELIFLPDNNKNDLSEHHQNVLADIMREAVKIAENDYLSVEKK